LVVFVLHRRAYQRRCIGSNGAGGSGGGACIGTLCRCLCCGQHLRWPFEPSCHIWIGCGRQHHPLNRFLVLDCPIVGFYPCMSPPKLGYRKGIFFKYYAFILDHNRTTYDNVFWLLSQSIPTHGLAYGMNGFQGVVCEIIITFALVYTVYATAADPKKGSLGTIAPIAIGFIVGANILAAGPFSGGSMNPARSFGPAVVSGNFADNWVYWVGPLIGGGLAGFIYGDVFIGSYAAVPASETYP